MTQPNVEWPNLNAQFVPEGPTVVDAKQLEADTTNFQEDDNPQSLVGDEVTDESKDAV